MRTWSEVKPGDMIVSTLANAGYLVLAVRVVDYNVSYGYGEAEKGQELSITLMTLWHPESRQDVIFKMQKFTGNEIEKSLSIVRGTCQQHSVTSDQEI